MLSSRWMKRIVLIFSVGMVTVSCGGQYVKTKGQVRAGHRSPEEPRAADSAESCRREHDLLVESFVSANRSEILARIRRLAEVYRHLRNDGPVDTRAVTCKELIEPTLRDVGKVWFVEGRPGHPDTYPATREVLQIYLDLFPESDHTAIMSYRLAEVVAVLAMTTRAREDWREAARRYGQAFDLADTDDVIAKRNTTLSLRAESFRGKVISLSNAASPYDPVAQDHLLALVALQTYLDTSPPSSKREGDELRLRRDVLLAITSTDRRDTLDGLWKVAAEAHSSVAMVARDVLIMQLVSANSRERETWVRRLGDGTIRIDEDLRGCLDDLRRTGNSCEMQRRDDWWFAKPW